MISFVDCFFSFKCLKDWGVRFAAYAVNNVMRTYEDGRITSCIPGPQHYKEVKCQLCLAALTERSEDGSIT
jgi:hypothetical protein